MTRRGLADLRADLARAADVAGLDDDTRTDYEAARDLVAELQAGFDDLGERLRLNADLPQLAFHLAEELRAGPTVGGLRFMRRHIPRLLAEFRDRAYERLDPLDAELLVGLARLTRNTYEARFAERYTRAAYRRPFVDKLYRDYGLTGIPAGLLLELHRLATGADHDAVLCVLKGALPYVLLMELLGLPRERVRYVKAGRSTGSHVAAEYVVAPLGFDVAELAGLRVLVVDNNAATGATLTHLADALPEADTTLLLDYVLQPLPVLATRYRRVIVGPFANGDERRARALRERVVAGLRARSSATRPPVARRVEYSEP